MTDAQRKMILDFFQKERYAVVCSLWEGAPEAAVVAFTSIDFELIFATFKSTRKYRNLEADPRTAIVVGWDESITVQYQGHAIATSGEEREKCERLHLQKHPGSERYANKPGQAYFQVSPKWIRYTDISQEPEFSFEVTFD